MEGLTFPMMDRVSLCLMDQTFTVRDLYQVYALSPAGRRGWKKNFNRTDVEQFRTKLVSVAAEGIADQQWHDAAIRGSDSCHNMPQH